LGAPAEDPIGRRSRDASSPISRDPWGWGRLLHPPFCRRMRRIYGGPRPVNRSGMLEPLEQALVNASPYACLLPVAQALPAGHAATAKLLRQILPRDASAQNEHDAGQRHSVGRPGAASSRPTEWLGQRQFDFCPQFVINESASHSFHRAKSVPSSQQAQAF
jgi:hypothetical protein